MCFHLSRYLQILVSLKCFSCLLAPLCSTGRHQLCWLHCRGFPLVTEPPDRASCHLERRLVATRSHRRSRSLELVSTTLDYQRHSGLRWKKASSAAGDLTELAAQGNTFSFKSSLFHGEIIVTQENIASSVKGL